MKLLDLEKNYLKNVDKNWNYITPVQYNAMRKTGKDDFFVIDLRKEEDYIKGHIPGAINIFWMDILENLEKLPKDKPILLVCYVGHTASQVMVLLSMLGYKVTVLKFGMGVSPDPSIPVKGWKKFEQFPITKDKIHSEVTMKKSDLHEVIGVLTAQGEGDLASKLVVSAGKKSKKPKKVSPLETEKSRLLKQQAQIAEKLKQINKKIVEEQIKNLEQKKRKM